MSNTNFIHTPPTPKLLYTPEAWADMWYVINKCPKEVGWMCFTEKQGNDFLITSIFVPEQTVTGAETDIDKTAMATTAMDLLDQGAHGNVLAWGHSHVMMGTGPSGQDNTQLAEFLKDPDVPYFIRSIYNKRGESNTVIYEPHRNVWHANVQSEVFTEAMSAEREAELDAIILANVKERKYPVTTGYKNNYPYNGNRNNGFSNQNGKKNLGSNSTQLDILDEFDDAEFDDDTWFQNADLWPNLGV